MSAFAHLLEVEPSRNPLRKKFMGWQCRVRQMAMRESEGRPDDAIMPAVTLAGDSEPMGHIITLISKNAMFSVTPEFAHMVRQTNDPAQRRQKAIQYLSSAYYQKADEFSDVLTATFQPGSLGAHAIIDRGACTLEFEAYGQRFVLQCQAKQLQEEHPLYQATRWHNLLFNPTLAPDSIIIGFKPDWEASSSERAA
ncbi:MAG: hypothetical protein H6884_02075 [Rhodobiaceae bacterium]|nr:hypothetical protein [Rhodobiaceae bacterium]MCC0052827.1 hypothetical protein [Rhodobiaceae bacterium]